MSKLVKMDDFYHIPKFGKNSVMYYFSKNDIVKIDNYTIMYRIPHSKKTTWTTFKYGYIGNKLNTPLLDIKIVSGIDHEISYRHSENNDKKEENVWYSINPIRSCSSLYFQVTFPCIPSLEKGIRILLVGTIRPKNVKQNHMLSN